MTRKALVIGNGKYDGSFALKNAVNDADAIAAALARNGFGVTTITDANAQAMLDAALAFGKSLAPDGAGVFYFAGHGVQIDGENYLVGLDADHGNEASTKHHSLKLGYLVDLMDGARSETNILILDACRNDPWGSGWTRSAVLGGLATVTAPRGTLIAFSTSPGQKSLDGTGSHGRYTEALLQHIDAVCPVETMFKRVRTTLAAASTNKQVPWEHTSLVAEFYFNRNRNVPTTVYSDQAVQDGTFLADPSKPAHDVIRGLRSHSWDGQNLAANQCTPAGSNTFSDSECFMIGRGLYSAAVGDSNRAKGWINSFVGHTTGMAAAKRRAVLDGMLFEIFFDRDGKLRREPKAKFLDTLFKLAKMPGLRDSFEFVVECLVQTGKTFHAFPDLDGDVSVDVLTRADTGKPAPAITGIMIGGRNILTLDAPAHLDENGVPLYSSQPERSFLSKLSEAAAIPESRLKVNYPDLAERPKELRYPYGHSLTWAI